MTDHISRAVHTEPALPFPEPSFTVRRERCRQQSGSERTLAAVPLSVWLSQPLTGCCRVCLEPVSAACAQRLPLALAVQITEAFSRPGEVVFAPDAGNASLLIGPASCGRKVYGLVRGSDHGHRVHDRITTHSTEVASLAVIRTAPGGDALRMQSRRITGRAALAILAPHNPTTPGELAALLDAAQRALRPGGVVVLCARQTSGQDNAGVLTAHAQSAGFRYLQHIAAVEAAPDGDRLLPVPDLTDHGPDCTCTPGRGSTGHHQIVHNDLLAFTK